MDKEFKKEHILFVVDVDNEANLTDLSNNEELTRLDLVKQAISNFVHIKEQMNSGHSYSLMILEDTARMACANFKDVGKFCTEIAELKAEESYNSCDFSSVYRLANPSKRYQIIRIIFIYFRSKVLLTELQTQYTKKFAELDNCYFDAIYIHTNPDPQNFVQDIYNAIQAQEKSNGSYIFETCSNGKKFYYAFAQLLANASQRVRQDKIQINY